MSHAAEFWTRATPDVVDRRLAFDWDDDADDKETVTMTAADHAARVFAQRSRERKPRVQLRLVAPTAGAPEPVVLSAPELMVSASLAGFLLVTGLVACSMSVVVVVSLGLTNL